MRVAIEFVAVVESVIPVFDVRQIESDQTKRQKSLRITYNGKISCSDCGKGLWIITHYIKKHHKRKEVGH